LKEATKERTKTAERPCGLEERTSEYITEMLNPWPATTIWWTTNQDHCI